jgi:nitronate monooxygenase
MSMTFREKLGRVVISGKEVYPIIEGGKGIAATNGTSAGAFAAADAVGTVSGVYADSYDAHGQVVPYTYKETTRRGRNRELIALAVEGAVEQIKVAHAMSGGKGRIHMNVLWEMANCQEVLHEVLSRTKGMVHGVTCGAGMPYKLSEIAEQYNVYYLPIVSSMRAFRALWKRAYSKTAHLLSAVVYEDPWLAGGHNGLSNGEDPEKPEDPYPRVAELRSFMNEVGLQDVPIVMAGGAWHLAEWEHWLDNPEIGKIAFQFGTRPLLTKESPVPAAWKRKLMTLKEGDVFLNRFSPTGFYSSAVNNPFIQELRGREERQVEFKTAPEGEYTEILPFGPRKRPIYVTAADKAKGEAWIAAGFDELMKTPDDTVIFVPKAKADEIVKDQVDCMGCLSQCRFSNWKDHDDYTTGKKADPRSFCIQKTLQEIAHGGDVENELMFSGHNAFRFASDPLYAGGHVPSVAEMIACILDGK